MSRNINSMEAYVRGERGGGGPSSRGRTFRETFVVVFCLVFVYCMGCWCTQEKSGYHAGGCVSVPDWLGLLGGVRCSPRWRLLAFEVLPSRDEGGRERVALRVVFVLYIGGSATTEVSSLTKGARARSTWRTQTQKCT